MSNEISQAIRKFVAENFLYRDGIESFKDDASFLAAGVMDSTGVLELVFFLENTYGIKVADEEMLPENLDSVNNIANYVARKLQAQATPAAGAATATL